MEDVQKFFRHLVRVLSEGERDRSREPIEVAEIYQSILPYRRFRGVLEFDTNQDYEMALLRLLAGEGGLASIDPVEAQEALSEEAASVNPNPAAYRDYAAAKVYLNVNAVQDFSDDRDPYAPPQVDPDPMHNFETPRDPLFVRPDPRKTPTFESEPVPTSVPMTPPPRASNFEPSPTKIPFVPEPPAGVTPPPGLERGSMFTNVDLRPASCPFCDRGLPTKRVVKFCPYCGRDISMRRCHSCGTNVGPDWVFCAECGADTSR